MTKLCFKFYIKKQVVASKCESYKIHKSLEVEKICTFTKSRVVHLDLQFVRVLLHQIIIINERVKLGNKIICEIKSSLKMIAIH